MAFCGHVLSAARGVNGLGVVVVDEHGSILGATSKLISFPFAPLLVETLAIKERLWFAHALLLDSVVITIVLLFRVYFVEILILLLKSVF